MSSPLAYSMFQDVLFPAMDQSSQDSGQDFRLRRLKRYVPEPDHPLPESPIVIFDLETTGLDPQVDRIIEIGGIKMVGMKAVAEFSFLVSTDVELTNDIIKLTGIKPEMLVGQPAIADVLPQFLSFIEGSVLVAHNAEFDMSMLRAACSRQGIDLEWPCFCTLKMARELLPDLENRKLDTLASYYGLTFEARHRAIGDIKVTAGVLSGFFQGEAKGLRRWSKLQPYSVT